MSGMSVEMVKIISACNKKPLAAREKKGRRDG